MVEIIKIKDREVKKAITRLILEGLPEWFGLEDARESYIKEVGELDYWVAYIEDDAVGFIALSESSSDCGEIHSMGVKKELHGRGIGRSLVEELEDSARESYSLLQVKTVNEGHYDEYDGTNAFYKAMGFYKLEVFPDLWDSWNPCLIWVKSLKD